MWFCLWLKGAIDGACQNPVLPSTVHVSGISTVHNGQAFICLHCAYVLLYSRFHEAFVLSVMELSHFRSATNLRSRPIGPRSQKTMPANDLPSDLTSGLESEASPVCSPLHSSTSTTRACSPEGHKFYAPQTSHELGEEVQETSQDPAAPVAECSRKVLVESSIQTDDTSPTLEVPTTAPTRSSSPVVRKIPKPPTLVTPPAVKFDSETVQWRGMTLEVAQWTFSSQELQEIVSTAIRKSAHESFIHLVSTKVFEEELAAELQRLETVRMHYLIGAQLGLNLVSENIVENQYTIAVPI